MIADELAGWTIAVLGGDLRMLEYIRQARAAGAKVQHYGSAPGAQALAGQPASASLKDAVKGARILCCPIPAVGTDSSLYAKFTDEKLYLTTDVLQGAAPNAMLFSSRVTPQMAAWAEGTGVKMIALGKDDALAILHATPTAEGAVKIAIENTVDTLRGLDVLCISLGKVGTTVAETFQKMSARVTVAARNPAQLARAWTMNLTPLDLRELPEKIGSFPLIVSSSSGLVLDRAMLERTAPDVVVIDLCSPPGSVDFKAGEELGRKVIWARSQAGTAPRTSGFNEWQVITRIVREQTPELAR
jgi:dipicolinate synthase subunit A